MSAAPEAMIRDSDYAASMARRAEYIAARREGLTFKACVEKRKARELVSLDEEISELATDLLTSQARNIAPLEDSVHDATSVSFLEPGREQVDRLQARFAQLFEMRAKLQKDLEDKKITCAEKLLLQERLKAMLEANIAALKAAEKQHGAFARQLYGENGDNAGITSEKISRYAAERKR